MKTVISSYHLSDSEYYNNNIKLNYFTGIIGNVLILSGNAYRISSIVSAERCFRRNTFGYEADQMNDFILESECNYNIHSNYFGYLITFSSGRMVAIGSNLNADSLDNFFLKLVKEMELSSPISALFDSTPSIRDSLRVLLDSLESNGA